jgi:hypothetical protein
MANTIKIKRSAVQGKVPGTGDLELGELAVNTYDGRLFTKKDNGTATVVEIGGGSGGVSDGDKGDITVSSAGGTWTIDNDAVTYAKIQNVSDTDKLLGRSSSGSGDVEEIACTAAGRALLDDADAAAQRTTLGLGTLATQSGTFSGTSSGTNTGDQTITLTGDVTGSGTGSFAATLASSGVTAASYTATNLTVDVKGRITAASNGTVVSTFSGGTTGLTPGTATSGAITLAGTLAVANGGTGVTTSTGTGSAVLSTSPTLVTPLLGTPTSGTLTNCTGYTFANLASKPTTLSGYGITDAATSTHVHGNITNAGAIGSTANLPIITTTSGVLTTGSFGTTAGTFCQGNDSRLSDARTPTDGSVTDTKVAANAAIADTKLATISTAGKVSNSATTATSANTVSAIVARDASGNFSAGTITANLTGTATNASAVPWSGVSSKPTTISGFGITDAPTFSGANAFTGANTFTNATGQIFRQAATQDGVLLRGRAGGAGSFTVEVVPTTLTASRTLTAPDVSGTLITSGDTSTVTNAMLAGSIANAKLANSTISGVALGGTLSSLTVTSAGGGAASGSTFNGSSAVTISHNSIGALAATGGTLTGDVTLNAQSSVRFADLDSTHWVAFRAPSAVTANVTWTLPAADGTSGQVLSTDGTGTLAWTTPSSGGQYSTTLALS